MVLHKMKNLIYHLIICIIFSSLCCYTIVENNSSAKRNNLIYSNHKLVGVWINKVLWMDYGYKIKKLKFFLNGEATFYPNSESYNSTFYTGKFEIKNDTLKVQLFNNSFEEIFIYEVNNTNLILEKVDIDFPININITNNKKESWEKVK